MNEEGQFTYGTMLVTVPVSLVQDDVEIACPEFAREKSQAQRATFDSLPV